MDRRPLGGHVGDRRSARRTIEAPPARLRSAHPRLTCHV